MVSDFRFPGGTSSSLATEIRAQAAAGYRTALLQIPATLLKTPRPFNEKIQACIHEGLAELVLADEPLRAKLLVVRHPGIFSVPPPFRLDVESAARVMVVNQVPNDNSQPEPYYDVARCARIADAVFGTGFEWAPIGPLVRDALLSYDGVVPLSDGDWYNVLRSEDWSGSRNGFVSDRPVIGRHSRPHWRKWPETAERILAAYPDNPSYRVRILGGAEVPRKIIGHIPSNWEVLPFNGVPAPEFLRSIDFFVYFHHSGLVEAFGRAVIEAMASGAVAVVPRSFERLFSSACVYGGIDDVQRLVWDLYADPERYHAQALAGMDYVKEHFSWQAHVKRIAERAGPGTGAPDTIGAATNGRRSVVLLVARPCANEEELLALIRGAEGLPQGAAAVLVTDTRVLGRRGPLGVPVEHAPAHPDLPADGPDAVAAAVERALRTHRPAAAIVQDAGRQPRVTAFLESQSVAWEGIDADADIAEYTPRLRQSLAALLGQPSSSA